MKLIMTRAIRFQGPLTQQELADLEKFLRCNGKTIVTGIQLQGFFGAVLTSPTPIDPYVWRSIVFGKHYYFKNNDEAIYMLDLVLRFLNQVDLQKVPLVAAFLGDGEGDINFQNHQHYELRGMWRIGYFQGKALWNEEYDPASMMLTDLISLGLGFRSRGLQETKALEYLSAHTI